MWESVFGWDWAIPWTYASVVNAIFLLVATLIVGFIPIYYLFKANLRDPLARAVLAGTSATAFIFTVSFVILVLFHAGVAVPGPLLDWLTRLTYLIVALGETAFLFALVRVIREGAITDRERERERQKNYDEGYAAHERDTR